MMINGIENASRFIASIRQKAAVNIPTPAATAGTSNVGALSPESAARIPKNIASIQYQTEGISAEAAQEGLLSASFLYMFPVNPEERMHKIKKNKNVANTTPILSGRS